MPGEAGASGPTPRAGEIVERGREALDARLARFAARLRALSGFRRGAILYGLGCAATGALPPLDFLFLLPLVLPPLLWIVDGAASRAERRGLGVRALVPAFWTGWWFGFGYFSAGLYWVGSALLVDAARFGWLLPFATFGLPAGLAIFPGLGVMLAVLLWPSGRDGDGTRPIARILILAASWTGAEWLRATLLTGFPWNLIGYAADASDALAQVASLVGVHGLGFLLLAVALSPAALFERPAMRGGRWLAPGLALLLLAGAWGFGAERLATAERRLVPGAWLRLVQPNVPQAEKWRGDLRERHLEDLVALSRRPGILRISHVIWPEVASAFFLDNDPAHAARAARAAAGGKWLLTGAVRFRREDARAETYKLWNSFHVLNARGRVAATYDKRHLVPFGEFLPVRWLFGKIGLDKLVYGPADYSSGTGATVIEVPNLPPVRPLICYEDIFASEILDGAPPALKPGWLLNVTNDGWFGRTAGPHQHFAMARFRAIEQGLPLVRVANTGISGLIDAHGRVVASLPLGTSGILDIPLPEALPQPPLYSRIGDSAIVAFLIAMLAWAVWRKEWGLGRAPDRRN